MIYLAIGYRDSVSCKLGGLCSLRVDACLPIEISAAVHPRKSVTRVHEDCAYCFRLRFFGCVSLTSTPSKHKLATLCCPLYALVFISPDNLGIVAKALKKITPSTLLLFSLEPAYLCWIEFIAAARFKSFGACTRVAYRRRSSSLSCCSERFLLITSHNRNIKLSDLTESDWRTAASCF